MRCKECNYKVDIKNTNETGDALCSYTTQYFLINIEDQCRFIPETTDLTCGDCQSLLDDMGCFGCLPEESAVINGKLCKGFRDKKEKELRDILLFWKTHNYYDRERIDAIIEDFEKEYDKLTALSKEP